MNEIRTNWCKQAPLYGAFDDCVIIESIEANERVLIRPEEFDFLPHLLYDNWMLRRSKYIQLLREWNECAGFNDLEEKPSTLNDIQDTINAIQLLEGVSELEFDKISMEDMKLILEFLIRNKASEIKIRKE